MNDNENDVFLLFHFPLLFFILEFLDFLISSIYYKSNIKFNYFFHFFVWSIPLLYYIIIKRAFILFFNFMFLLSIEYNDNEKWKF